MFLNPSYQANFLQTGAVVVDGFADRWLDSLRDCYSRLQAKKSSAVGFHSTILSRDLAHRSQVHYQLQALLQPLLSSYLSSYRPILCTFSTKSAQSPSSEVPIHQDWSFVDESKFTSVGFWCPLTDVDLDNGCLQIVKGSHRSATLLRAACTPFLYPQLIPLLQTQYLTPMPMKAGQAIFFDNRLFHCSPTNRSRFDRVAATAVLIPADSQLMYYHAPDPNQPQTIERFAVDDDFYMSHIPGTRPELSERVKLVP